MFFPGVLDILHQAVIRRLYVRVSLCVYYIYVCVSPNGFY